MGLPPSTNRIIAKRIILTGHPYKIHKKLVTIRYMFFNDADVEYFKALQLWTRRGRSGFIKEPLGTHGVQGDVRWECQPAGCGGCESVQEGLASEGESLET